MVTVPRRGESPQDAAILALQRKGLWGGLQSGVIVLPVLVANSAVIAQPAVVELATGRSHTFHGTRFWGMAFNGLIKSKQSFYLPDPV